jgi:hemerythrin-like metal-binding protein
MTQTDSSPLLWNESYNTGVSEVDEQHRILVNTLNEANVKLTDESSLELFEQITRDLLSYALYHFETEEGIMKECGYAEENLTEYELHLHEHRSFSSTVVSIRDGLKLGKRVPRDELLAFLNNWLINHILHTDKLLGAFVASKQG